jgi:hypothetical protein
MLKYERRADGTANVLGKNLCLGFVTLTAAPDVLASGSPGVIYTAVLKLAIMFGLAVWTAIMKVPCAVKVRVWGVLAAGLSYLVALGSPQGPSTLNFPTAGSMVTATQALSPQQPWSSLVHWTVPARWRGSLKLLTS